VELCPTIGVDDVASQPLPCTRVLPRKVRPRPANTRKTLHGVFVSTRDGYFFMDFEYLTRSLQEETVQLLFMKMRREPPSFFC